MIKIVESFSKELPSWLVRDKSIVRYLNKRNVDLNKATYVPDRMISSGRDKRLKDSNKIQVFLINANSSRYPEVYIVGTEGPYIHIGNRYDYASKFSMKDLLSIAVEYGYIDISDATNTNTDIKAQRRDAKAGSIDRGRGQYKYNKVRYDKGDDGYTDWDNPIDDGYEWFNTPGEDKSGYKLPDPNKYVKMLNQVDKSNYGRRVTGIYNKIKNLKSSIDNIEISPDTGVDISNMYKAYSDVIRAYSDLLTHCKSAVEKDYDHYFDGGSDRYSFYNFTKDATNVEDEIKYCKGLLSKFN